jgi:hypothetical protein
VLGRLHHVDGWIMSGLLALVERSDPLTLDEAQRLGIKDSVLISQAREAARTQPKSIDRETARSGFAHVFKMPESVSDGKLAEALGIGDQPPSNLSDRIIQTESDDSRSEASTVDATTTNHTTPSRPSETAIVDPASDDDDGMAGGTLYLLDWPKLARFHSDSRKRWCAPQGQRVQKRRCVGYLLCLVQNMNHFCVAHIMLLQWVTTQHPPR